MTYQILPVNVKTDKPISASNMSLRTNISFSFPGHKAYVKGTPGFDKVVAAFGEEIIGEDGEINRKSLGAKVFADKVILVPKFMPQ